MSEFSQQLTEEQYRKLPDELKAAISSTDIAEKMFEIGRKFALSIEKNGFLAEETAFVVLGLIKPGGFPAVIKARLEVSEEEAQEIAKEVSNQIFFPIREALKKTHQVEIKDEGKKTPETMTPPAPVEVGSLGRRGPTSTLEKSAEPPAPEPPKSYAAPGVIPQEEIEKIKEEFKRKAFVRPVPAEKLPPTPPPPAPARPVELPTKELPQVETKNFEPIPPPAPAKPKIAPIDLRQGAKPRLVPPEFMRDTIFAPPNKENLDAKTEKPAEKAKEIPVAPPVEKKTPSKGYDPYRESTE